MEAPPGTVTMETPGPLQPLLGWLATLPLREIRIEPVGLRAVYDRFHPPAGDAAPSDSGGQAAEAIRPEFAR